MPAFTLPKLDGDEFVYQGQTDGVLVVAFISAHQSHSERACEDLETTVSQFRSHAVQLVAVTVGTEDNEYFQARPEQLNRTLTVFKSGI